LYFQTVYSEGIAMTGTELIGMLLSVGLLLYLAVALLKPEWFA
jgi:K+-transporting ATPase KdpF subunit